jgi:hypothetical protein
MRPLQSLLLRCGWLSLLVLAGLLGATDASAKDKDRGSSNKSGRSGGESSRGSDRGASPKVREPRSSSFSPKRQESSAPRISQPDNPPPPSPKKERSLDIPSARSRVRSSEGLQSIQIDKPGKSESRVETPRNKASINERLRSLKSARESGVAGSNAGAGDAGPSNLPPPPVDLTPAKPQRTISRSDIIRSKRNDQPELPKISTSDNDSRGDAKVVQDDGPAKLRSRELRLGKPDPGSEAAATGPNVLPPKPVDLNADSPVRRPRNKGNPGVDLNQGPLLPNPAAETPPVANEGSGSPRDRRRPQLDLPAVGAPEIQPGPDGPLVDRKLPDLKNEQSEGRLRLPPENKGNPGRLRRPLVSQPLEPAIEKDGVPLKDAAKVAHERHQKQDAEYREHRQPSWAKKIDSDKLHKLSRHSKAEKIHLHKQYALHHHGDVSRQLNLHVHLQSGGWDHRHVGIVSSSYRRHCFHSFYWGPSWYPRHCWYPVWSTWVHWSWGYYCDPIWDPRPVICRPIVYRPCHRWAYWDYPVWQPLPVVSCGTWVDVAPVVIDQGYDLQLLAVRFIDPGHAERNLGPRYRAWVRLNGNQPLRDPFSVVVMATNGQRPGDDRLEAGVQVESIEPGQTLAVDVRLPLRVDGEAGDVRDYSNLHVLVDGHRQINESNRSNNGAVLARKDVLPVDPVLFASESDLAVAGSVINLAGEGLGPEPGEVLLQVGDDELPVEIVGWYDLGVRIKLPNVPLSAATPAQIVLVRGDTAATNPLQVQLIPAGPGQSF